MAEEQEALCPYYNYTNAERRAPLWQKWFVVLRPEWLRFGRQFWTWQEVSGALGDLGTFLPLVTALAVNNNQISFGPALFYAGVFTLFTSTYYDIPIPIQPMKTITSVALVGVCLYGPITVILIFFPTENHSRDQIVAAGIGIALVMLLFAATGLIRRVSYYIPLAIVRGIQLGLGLALFKKGIAYAYVEDSTSKEIIWFGIDSVLVSVLGSIFCLWFLQSKKVPTALILFSYGVAIAIYNYNTKHIKEDKQEQSLSFGPHFEAPIIPSWTDFRIAFLELVLPQLPLTLLNSVVALEILAKDLFPNRPGNLASVTRTSFSIGLGNLCFCWFGMVPTCHGAGGLASQYAFGARSNVSMLFLGTVKVFVALLFGSSSVVLLQTGIFPGSILGVMLCFSALNLCLVTFDITNRIDAIIMIVTAGMTLSRNTGLGFLAGICTTLILRFSGQGKPTK